jgi:hypothetical protein
MFSTNLQLSFVATLATALLIMQQRCQSCDSAVDHATVLLLM